MAGTQGEATRPDDAGIPGGQVKRQVDGRLANGLGEAHKGELTKWIDLGPWKGSWLGWLRRVPRSCSAAGLLDLLQRLSGVRGWGVPLLHRS